MRLGTCFCKKEGIINEKEIMDEVVFCIPAYFYYPIYNILFFRKSAAFSNTKIRQGRIPLKYFGEVSQGIF